MHERSLVLKQDVLGRVRVPVERRLAVVAVVAVFRRSGLSGAQFARLAGMKYPTPMAWVKREGGGAAVRRKGPLKRRPVLVEAVVAAPGGTSAPLLVHLGGGVRMELSGAGQAASAAQLIQALRKSC